MQALTHAKATQSFRISQAMTSAVAPFMAAHMQTWSPVSPHLSHLSFNSHPFLNRTQTQTALRKLVSPLSDWLQTLGKDMIKSLWDCLLPLTNLPALQPLQTVKCWLLAEDCVSVQKRATQIGAIIFVTLLDSHKDCFVDFAWLVMLLPASHDSITLGRLG